MQRSAPRALALALLLLLVLTLVLGAAPALAQSSSSSSSSVFRSASASGSVSAASVSSSASSASASASAASDALRSDTALGVLTGLGEDGISAGPAALAAAGILLGATANIAGFRLFRPVVFLGALVAGGYLIALVVERAVHEDSDYVVLCSWIAFGVGGLVAGGAAAAIEKLGRMTVGACAGVLFAGLLNVGIGHKIDATEPDRLLLVLQVIVGFVSALAALDSVFLILSLSFSGSVVLMYCIGYFAGSFPIGSDLADYRTANQTESWLSAVPVAWWIYLAVFLLVLALGLYVQIIKAREHGYYDENGKFVYAAHSDDEPESSGHAGNRGRGVHGSGVDDDDDDRKSPNHANFQNFAPYQPPPTTAATENQSSSAYPYPSSDISYGPSANSASNYGNSRSGASNYGNGSNHNASNRSSRSGSRRPASNYPQPYTSYYTRPSASTASSQPSRPTYRQQRFTPTSPM